METRQQASLPGAEVVALRYGKCEVHRAPLILDQLFDLDADRMIDPTLPREPAISGTRADPVGQG